MKKNVGLLILMIGAYAASVSASEWALVYPPNFTVGAEPKLVVGAVTSGGVAIFRFNAALSLGCQLLPGSSRRRVSE